MIELNSLAKRFKAAIALCGGLAVMTGATLPLSCPSACALGVLATPPVHMHVTPHVRVVRPAPKSSSRKTTVVTARKGRLEPARSPRTRTLTKAAAAKRAKAMAKPAAPAKPLQPQAFSDQMSSEVLAPGVVHKFFRGPLSINLLDIDMLRAPVKVQPSLAGNSFDRLKDVADHAKQTKAIAAVNANYFKRNGTPLGTLIIDGEWVAGPLYDRVSMGITREGTVRIDRVSLGGHLTSNNPDLPETWVNNINQPHRTGCHLFAYTHRWGSFVRMPYEACLVAVDAQGNVVDKSTKDMGIPWGGYVLCDAKNAPITKLKRGDKVDLSWRTTPSWDDVTEAVSGGPMLIKDGKLYVDLKDEKFRKGWTGSQIRARTVAGVTANNHLLLATIEGPHTLWDIAKFLAKLGAVDAMNLDGGGSTTMVVDGKTVTRNANAAQRRVASSLVVLDTRKMPNLAHTYGHENRVMIEDIRPSDSITASLDADQPAEIATDAQNVAKDGVTAPAVAKDGVTPPTTAQQPGPKPADLPSVQIKEYAPTPVVGSSGHVKKSRHLFGLVGRH